MIQDITCEAEKIINSGSSIIKTDEIKQWLNVTKQQQVNDKLIRRVLLHEFDLKYHKVKKNAYNSNSERNLILRQQFAFKLLDLLWEGKRIINIDESWISDTNFTRMRWAKTDTPNSVEEHQVNPRLSLLAAIDTEGQVYIALTQRNTDTDVMKLYIWHLVQILEKEDKDFRENIVIQLDGARYHTN